MSTTTTRTFKQEFQEWELWKKDNRPIDVGSNIRRFFDEKGWVPGTYRWFFLAFAVLFFGEPFLYLYGGLDIPVIWYLFPPLFVLVASEVYVWRYSKLAFVLGLVPCVVVLTFIAAEVILLAT